MNEKFRYDWFTLTIRVVFAGERRIITVKNRPQYTRTPGIKGRDALPADDDFGNFPRN